MRLTLIAIRSLASLLYRRRDTPPPAWLQSVAEPDRHDEGRSARTRRRNREI